MPLQQTIKEFGFEAAHQTPPFSGLHGHSFRVAVVLTGEPDPVFGWTHNLYEVEPLIEQIRCELDHRYLNDIDGLAVPTLENVARWIWDRLDVQLSGLDCLIVRRGQPGQSESCVYSARHPAPSVGYLESALS
jgi:6-pyruvoyltetrahydropterin/6-carboxytetrahydropterin synthase